MPAPERTSLSAIIAAGRELLEESGPGALTMQRVAERVGVRAPSLYKRVRDREALLVAIATATVDDLADRLAASERTLSALARSYRGFARERPEAFRLMFSVPVPQERLESAAMPVLALTREVAGDRALELARFVTSWVTGFVQMELVGAFRLGGDVEQAFEYGLAHLDALRAAS